MKQATELEFLLWFYQECDFGPAHEDVIDIMKEQFLERTGKSLPKGYELEEEE
ncbi:hypothetical protein IID24_03315 [Patescibacteria group bacterium]|nr:hypothetical protein [Patescibacteria group bacterium]